LHEYTGNHTFAIDLRLAKLRFGRRLQFHRMTIVREAVERRPECGLLGRFGADRQRQDTVPLLEAAAGDQYLPEPRWTWDCPKGLPSGNARPRFSIRVDRNDGLLGLSRLADFRGM
jgi:hypothetical protein